jgi:hypothetical protein
VEALAGKKAVKVGGKGVRKRTNEKNKGVKERRLMVIHRCCPGFKTDERRGAPLGGGGAARCAVEVNRLEKKEREKTGERAVSHEGGGGVCVWARPSAKAL